MRMPKPRGGLSEWIVARLAERGAVTGSAPAADSWDDEAIALWTLHELSYRGFEDADDRAEWDPEAARRAPRPRDRARGAAARALRPRWPTAPTRARRRPDRPRGRSWPRTTARRSPTTSAGTPTATRCSSCCGSARSTTSRSPTRRPGSCRGCPVRAKAALMELQYDEYGDGDPNRLHAHLFARGLEAVGLRAEYGAYVDDALPETLEHEQRRSRCSACTAGCAAPRWVTSRRSR